LSSSAKWNKLFNSLTFPDSSPSNQKRASAHYHCFAFRFPNLTL